MAGGLSNDPAEVSRWWTAFNDPTLDSLIELAVAANHDLRIAQARLRQSRAQRDAATAGFWPTLDTSASFTRLRISDNTSIASLASGLTGGPTGGSTSGSVATSSSSGVSGASGSSGLPAGFPLESNLFQAGFDASWEIDVFGGKRRALEATTADLDADLDALHATRVSLLAEVARNYIELRGLQQRLAVTRKTIDSQRETLDLTRGQFESDLASELDVSQAEALLAGTQSQSPALEAAIRQTIHQLSVLLGQPPGALNEELSPEASWPDGPPDVPMGLPSDLLRRRPDVRQAERQLASATAQIGVQVAELFPKFSLTGAIGFQSEDLGNWFTGGSQYWSFGPAVRWRIFDAGRIQAQIHARMAMRDEALARYEKTVLTSLQEVEDAIATYAAEQIRRDALHRQVESSLRALEIATSRHEQGVGSFLEVLASQRTLYQAQDQLAQSETNIRGDLITLYKALGGGW